MFMRRLQRPASCALHFFSSVLLSYPQRPLHVPERRALHVFVGVEVAGVGLGEHHALSSVRCSCFELVAACIRQSQ